VRRDVVGRYYDPKTGQFLSVDPEVRETQQPYGYAGDDPTNVIDPSGLSALVLRCNGVVSWASASATAHGIIARLSYDCLWLKVFWLVTFTRPTWNGHPIVSDIYEHGLLVEPFGLPTYEASLHLYPWGDAFHGTISHEYIGQRYLIFDIFNFLEVNDEGQYGETTVEIASIIRAIAA